MILVDSASPVLLDLRIMHIAVTHVTCLGDLMYTRIKVCVIQRFVGVWGQLPRLGLFARWFLGKFFGCDETV